MDLHIFMITVKTVTHGQITLEISALGKEHRLGGG